MNNFVASIVGVFALLVSVAVIATLVSSKSQTSQLITSLFGGFANTLKAAVSPLTS